MLWKLQASAKNPPKKRNDIEQETEEIKQSA